VALVTSRCSPDLWLPCAQRVLPGDRFCAMHRNALDGVVLGLLSETDVFDNVATLTPNPERSGRGDAPKRENSHA
jgi:hypothetical protein